MNNIQKAGFGQLEVEETGKKIQVIREFELAKNKMYYLKRYSNYYNIYMYTHNVIIIFFLIYIIFHIININLKKRC